MGATFTVEIALSVRPPVEVVKPAPAPIDRRILLVDDSADTLSDFRGIAISGYGSESDRAEALAAGFDDHLSKPVSIERLRALLENLGP